MFLTKIHVSMLPTTSARQTFIEAVRLSQLLHVAVEYRFNDLTICVMNNYLVYAVDESNKQSSWFESIIE